MKLGTAADGDTWGTFTFTNKGQGVLTSLDEYDASSPQEFCAAGRNCFGQVVHTEHRQPSRSMGCWRGQTTWSLDVVAPGVNDRNVVIVHTPDGGRRPGGHLPPVHERPADARRRAGERAVLARLDRRQQEGEDAHRSLVEHAQRLRPRRLIARAARRRRGAPSPPPPPRRSPSARRARPPRRARRRHRGHVPRPRAPRRAR